MITKTEILKMKEPEELFSEGDIKTIKNEYLELVKTHHPDKGGDSETMMIINTLKEKAIKRVENCNWKGTSTFCFSDYHGTKYRIRYKYKNEFELGNVYVNDTKVIYFIDKKYKELYENGIEKITGLRFDSDMMQMEMERFLPKKLVLLKTEDCFVVIKEKKQNTIPLIGIQKTFPKGLDPKHTAWIIGSLLNMSCYLYWSRIVHLGIDKNTYFIDYKNHSGHLLGGWWYCKNIGEKIKQVSKYTYENMNRKDKTVSKTANPNIDMSIIKSIGRDLMGEYMSKIKHPEFSKMIDWFLLPSNKKPNEEYKKWEQILEKTFGCRKFVIMDININDIYKNLIKEN